MTEHPDTITVAKCHPFRGDNFYITLPGSDRSGFEYIRADISAARISDLERQLAEAREVKPLEWAAGMHERQYAKVMFGQYSVRDFGDGDVWGDFDGVIFGGKHPTLEAAKAAAQADYTARILSALKGTP